MSQFTHTTIRGQFDHYSIEDFMFQDGTTGQQIKVNLINCEDLQTGQVFPELAFNLTKSFQSFGCITDHPTIEVACRHYNDGGYSFPNNVSFANPYPQFTNSLEKNMEIIEQHAIA